MTRYLSGQTNNTSPNARLPSCQPFTTGYLHLTLSMAIFHIRVCSNTTLAWVNSR